MLAEFGISKGRAARFILLPEILPRIHAFFKSGLGHIAFFIAVVFNTVRILPDGHAYLKSANHGKYSVFQAFAAAADNISFSKNNLDKIAIFIVLMTGIVILFLQFILLFFTVIVGKALAAGGPSTLADFFKDNDAHNDLAFRLLDLVFGVPGIFNSMDATTTPFHHGMHALFEFYSFGIMLVGVIIIVYLSIAIVLETAQSGVPFGKRFNKAWAPIRLILFFGLLLPATHGLNFAQYLVLSSAKLGSNVATNGWMAFDEAVTNTYLGKQESLIAEPNLPGYDGFVSYMQLARVCAWAEGRVNGRDIKAYAVFGKGSDNAVEIDKTEPSFADFAERSKGGIINIRFGEQKDIYADQEGSVFPYCGTMSLTISDRSQPGSAVVMQGYLEMIGCFWHTVEWEGGKGLKLKSQGAFADAMGMDANTQCKASFADKAGIAYSHRYSSIYSRDPFASLFLLEGDLGKRSERSVASYYMKATLEKALETQVNEGDWLNDDAMKYGWAGAGIWYNKIAEQNGALTGAVFSQPHVTSMPYVLEFIANEKLAQDPGTARLRMYSPVLSSGKSIQFEEPQQRDVAIILNQLFMYWGDDQTSEFFEGQADSNATAVTGNIMIDMMNLFLGTKGLFDMCKNTDIHPLAQLSAMGRGMIEHAIRGYGTALVTGVLGGISGIMGQASLAAIKGALFAASSFFMTFASIGLILGFLLFYVIPMLPFIYFFFAVMTWIKSIFQAMVGMPLWALAHLRIDGDGMPGEAAASGYFYILEIFVRPICIVLGFMGGIAVFSAMVKVLNQIFYLVISNLTGHELSGVTGCFGTPGAEGAGAEEDTGPKEEDFKIGSAIDEFFYTVLYAIIVYLIAMPSFKMVDLVPDHIMRWLGAGISSFGSQDGDPVDGIMTHVSMGAGMIGQKVQGGLGGMTDAFK
jgi:conjugal transfer/type IV secretion protein DotA/TraY